MISDYIDKVTSNVTENVQSGLIDKFTDLQTYLMVSIWQSITDIILCILVVDIYWCCYCVIMNRDKISVPPFGEAKPMDNLFFLFSFYAVFRIFRFNHGL